MRRKAAKRKRGEIDTPLDEIGESITVDGYDSETLQEWCPKLIEMARLRLVPGQRFELRAKLEGPKLMGNAFGLAWYRKHLMDNDPAWENSNERNFEMTLCDGYYRIGRFTA